MLELGLAPRNHIGPATATSLAARGLAGEDCQLGFKSTFERGPRFGAGNVSREVRIFFKKARATQSPQHRYHLKVTSAERSVQPVGIAKPLGEIVEAVTDAVIKKCQAHLVPAHVPLQELGGFATKDWRLDGAERGEHPGNCASPGIRLIRQQPCVALRDMEDDRPRFKDGKLAFLIRGNLSERMQSTSATDVSVG